MRVTVSRINGTEFQICILVVCYESLPPSTMPLWDLIHALEIHRYVFGHHWNTDSLACMVSHDRVSYRLCVTQQKTF